MKRCFCISLAMSLLVAMVYAGEVPLTLLYTTDIHGHLEALGSEGEKTAGGGLLRCATLIKDIRAREPNVMLIDGGDLFQGSVESFLTGGAVISRVVQALRYDALVIGNHEFDWGLTNLLGFYAQTQLPVLAANISTSAAREPARFDWQPFIIKDLAGVRVAIIGLANPMTPGWIRPRLLEGLVFEKSVAALRRVLPAVRAQHADVLVLAAHQGWRQWGDDAANEINALARAFPEIDVILGGHTHVAVEGMELQGVAYIQPGAHGLWLAKVQMQVDTNRHCVVRRTAELIAVDSSIPQDPELTQQSAPALADTKNYLRQELGQTIRELSAQSPYPGQSSVQALLAAAIAEAVQADVVFHGTLSSASLAAGRIRMRDLWRIVPYENTIGVAQLTLAELAEILEENSRYWRTRQFRGLSGLTYELVRVSDAGPAKYQVQNIRLLDGSVPPPGARLRVAFNSHDLASAGARFPRLREIAEQPAARLQETDVDTRRAVRAYIQKHSPLDISAVESARLVRRRGSPKP